MKKNFMKSLLVAAIDISLTTFSATSFATQSGYATKHYNVYTNSSLTSRNSYEWIDEGDYVTVIQRQGNAYLVEYPTSTGAKKRRYVPVNGFSITTNQTPSVRLNRLMQTNGYKVGQRSSIPGQCYGFADNVYKRLFGGRGMSGYTSHNFGVANYPGSKIVGAIWNQAESNNARVVGGEFVGKAKPGCFVQMGRRYSLNSSKTAAAPHSAIVYSVSNTGVTLYEANTDNRNTIMKNTYSWATFANRNKGFTIYCPVNYK